MTTKKLSDLSLAEFAQLAGVSEDEVLAEAVKQQKKRNREHEDYDSPRRKRDLEAQSNALLTRLRRERKEK
jgi:hypothetical protein